MSQLKEKKVSDKDVDLTNQKRDVWLVKVPKYIADRSVLQMHKLIFETTFNCKQLLSVC